MSETNSSFSPSLESTSKTSLQNYKNSPIRSFGRIKSRKLSPHKNFLIAEFLPLYSIKIPQKNHQKIADEILDAAQLNSDSKNIENCLEIGFGFGDFLYDLASKNPQKKFYGCEPHLNGVVNLLAKLEKKQLANLKISTIDIRLLLSSFADKFFSEIFILFPDPWPKSKHFKRRLINSQFLDEIIAPKLRAGGKLIIATDHDSYKTWILSHNLRSKNFTWTAKSQADWQNFPQNWHQTKYQKKAEIEGRVSCYFEFIRT